MTAIHALLVEDEGPKVAHIHRFMRHSFSKITVAHAKSVSTALDAIDDERFDLLLLDMSLPTFDVGQGEHGGRPQGFGGIEILRHISMAGLSLPTIVLTGYEAFPDETGALIDLNTLRIRLIEEFPHNIEAVLRFNSSLDDWKISLRQVVERIIEGCSYA